MIVSCPACNARYRIDPGKIQGRGAKITCPRCSHKFVVYSDNGEVRANEPARAPMRSTADIAERDFRRVGVTWRVRKGMGVTYTFHDLASLNRHIEQGRVDGRDVLSYDARTWVPLDTIDDLAQYFEDIWRKAERGEILPPRPDATPMGVPPPGANDEEEEGPTTIMGHGHALMDDIRKAVAEATTPPPTQPRNAEPRRTPAKTAPVPEAPPRPRDPVQDDPTTFSRRSPATTSDLTPSTSDVRAASPSGPSAGRTAPAAPQVTQAREGSASENLLVVGISVVAIVVIVVAAWLLIGGQVQVGQPPAPPPGPVVAPPAVPVLPKPGLVAPPSAPPAAPAPAPGAAPPAGGGSGP